MIDLARLNATFDGCPGCLCAKDSCVCDAPPPRDFSGFRRGRALTTVEAKALSVGDVVWMTYIKDGYTELRINEATEVFSVDGLGLSLIPGGFTIDEGAGEEDPAIDWDHGKAQLYVALPERRCADGSPCEHRCSMEHNADTDCWREVHAEVVARGVHPDEPECPDCPECPDGGRVGPSAVGFDFYCYECCGTF